MYLIRVLKGQSCKKINESKWRTVDKAKAAALSLLKSGAVFYVHCEFNYDERYKFAHDGERIIDG